MITININTQPDDVTCGPTSLHAVYNYYGDTVPLSQVIAEVEQITTGGTLEALLGKHALKRGYRAVLYVYNLLVFDPTWFHGRKKVNLAEKLRAQLEYKKDPRFVESVQAYLDFLELGGEILFKDITPNLLKHYFRNDMPILTGLSSTYLYQSAREFVNDNGDVTYDDIRGVPAGHFVVLCGYDEKHHRVIVADPHPGFVSSNYYHVTIGRLINAIILGVLTYDANLLIIEPTLHTEK